MSLATYGVDSASARPISGMVRLSPSPALATRRRHRKPYSSCALNFIYFLCVGPTEPISVHRFAASLAGQWPVPPTLKTLIAASRFRTSFRDSTAAPRRFPLERSSLPRLRGLSLQPEAAVILRQGSSGRSESFGSAHRANR